MPFFPAASRDHVDLDRLGADLVHYLRGRWDGRRGQGMCLCPAHADRTPSLSVRIGERSLLFHCFAGCTNRAVVAALSRLNPNILEHGVAARPTRMQIDSDRMRRRVHQLWETALDMRGSPAMAYLAHRAIDRASDALRYGPHTPLGPRDAVQFRPAMLAAVHEGAQIVAVQRTFLDIGRGRRARDLRNPRRLLGQPGRGCVRLAPAFDVLGLAEGTESGLSAMLVLGLPVWATLGSERLARVDIPLSVRRLVLLADNDRAGRLAVDAALVAHAAPGRTIETRWPWHGLNDWNDVLRSGGKGVGNGRRHVA